MGLLLAKTKLSSFFFFTKTKCMLTDRFFFYFFKWLKGRMEDFLLKPIVSSDLRCGVGDERKDPRWRGEPSLLQRMKSVQMSINVFF